MKGTTMRKIFTILYFLFLVFKGWTQAKDVSNLTIHFIPTFNGTPIDQNQLTFIDHNNNEFSIEKLKFYISNVSLIAHTKESISDPQQYHLLDLNKPKSWLWNISNNSAEISQIEFSLGIDSITNVSGLFDGDLDPIHGMYWAWQSGYINFKLEGTHPDCNTRNQAFQFHLGGYLAPNQTIQHITLPVKDSSQINIEVDLNELLSKLDFSKEHKVMSPGPKAKALSNKTVKMFKIYEAEE